MILINDTIRTYIIKSGQINGLLFTLPLDLYANTVPFLKSDFSELTEITKTDTLVVLKSLSLTRLTIETRFIGKERRNASRRARDIAACYSNVLQRSFEQDIVFEFDGNRTISGFEALRLHDNQKIWISHFDFAQMHKMT